jgi:glycosyltransferase involved in cell wall biosynthesis
MQKITVFIPAYNAEKWLGPAIESILTQTYGHFTLLVIDDGSTDGTLALARSYQDPRIIVEANPVNLGIAETRNKALRLCATQWLACLDADDIAVSDRLRQQAQYLETHPETVVLGGQGEYFGDARGPARYPVGIDGVRRRILFDNPFMQNTVVLNVDWLKKKAIAYDPKAHFCEDYDFWAKIHLAGGVMANLDSCLVKYRVHAASVSRSRRQQQEAQANLVRQRLFHAEKFSLPASDWHFLDRYQFDGSPWIDRFVIATLRRLNSRLRAISPDPYERARFLCSALPRPENVVDGACLAVSLVRALGPSGAAFIVRFLGGRS